jgi:phospholipid N-methyltransferase
MQSRDPYLDYANFETGTVALLLANEYMLYQAVLEHGRMNRSNVSVSFLKGLLRNPRTIQAWPEEGIDLDRVAWEEIAEEWRTTCAEQVEHDGNELLRGDDSVIGILKKVVIDENVVRLPEQLPRDQYERVNRVLDLLGGKWNRKLRGHLFESSPALAISEVVQTGKFPSKTYNFGYFPTPDALANEVAAKADIEPGHLVLEPSLGQAHLARAILRAQPKCQLRGYEINPKNHAKLHGEFACDLADFLQVTPEPIYDRVVMNPPFEFQQDIIHVEHALKFLKPGGRLVAIMACSVSFREDRKASSFRKLLESFGGTISDNDRGAFKESGTMVGTVTLVITTPVLSHEPEPFALTSPPSPDGSSSKRRSRFPAPSPFPSL